MEFGIGTEVAARALASQARRPRSNARSGATLRVSRRFGAPPDRVFNAWIDPAIAGQWLFATASRPATRVDIDARVAGTFRFVDRHDGDHIKHAGVYVEVDRPRRLAFTLTAGKRREVTRVSVEIVPLGKGSELTLVHESVPADTAHHTEGRWTGMLYGLDQTLGSRRGRMSPA